MSDVEPPGVDRPGGDPDEVAQIYLDGVEAVVNVVGGFAPDQWSRPACGSWTAADTVRHLASVAGWYHSWLDRAIEGDTSRPFRGEQIDAYTAAALRDRRDQPAAEATEEFDRSAREYLARADEHREQPFGFPFGTVTVGLHLGVAAAEWHLHAWDLSVASERRHRPNDPGALLRSVGECVAAASGGVKGGLVRRVVPLVARRTPWETLLRRSGRG